VVASKIQSRRLLEGTDETTKTLRIAGFLLLLKLNFHVSTFQTSNLYKCNFQIQFLPHSKQIASLTIAD
jgi:hypothetical protein